MVFDDDFSAVSFVRYNTILPNWTDIVQHISQSGALDNIDLNDSWFTPDLEECPSKTPRHIPSIAAENRNKNLTSLQSRAHIHEVPNSKGASASYSQKLPVPKGVCNTSKLKKVGYAQNPSKATSGIPYIKEEKG